MLIVGLVLLIAALLISFTRVFTFRSPPIGVALVVLGFLACGYGTSKFVPKDQRGLLIRTWGPELPAGRVVADNGQKGPQAALVGPGWHFFTVIPFIQDIELVKPIEIPNGAVAVLIARDGKELPAGETYAPEWPSLEWLDAPTFVKNGYKGPQLTVLPPGLRYIHPTLFTHQIVPAISVPEGKVAVIKDKGGPLAVHNAEGTSTAVVAQVNGNPIVKQGYRGLWETALTPGLYYINPVAREPIFVSTAEYNYTYQNGVDEKGKPYHEAISIRTKDGFQVDVDVRVNVVVTAKNAPYLVAMIGSPDVVDFRVQEQEKLSQLEAVIILPETRSALRNAAEQIEALRLVNERSKFEQMITTQMRASLEGKRLQFNQAHIGNIDLTVTPAGKALLETQTEKRVAAEQIATYQQLQQAEVQRQQLVRAKTEADQEAALATAEKLIQINAKQADADVEKAKGQARAAIALAEGEKQAYELRASALGADNVARMEIIRAAGAANVVITPQVVAGDTNSALAGTLLKGGTSPAK